MGLSPLATQLMLQVEEWKRYFHEFVRLHSFQFPTKGDTFLSSHSNLDTRFFIYPINFFFFFVSYLQFSSFSSFFPQKTKQILVEKPLQFVQEWTSGAHLRAWPAQAAPNNWL